MIVEKSQTNVEVIYSDDKNHRYLIKRVWDDSLPSACVIMLSPSRTADAVALDMTSMYTINNCYKQGFGSVCIMNLYSALDSLLENNPDNDNMLVKTCKEVDSIILAWGKGKQTKQLLARADEVYTLLKPYSKKLFEISDGEDTGFHPLAKTVRLKWKMTPIKPNLDKLAKNKSVNKEVTSPAGDVTSY